MERFLAGKSSAVAPAISTRQFDQTCFGFKTSCQSSIESCQTASMLPGERDEIAVRDFICATHQFSPHHTVSATQVIGDEDMAGVGDKLSENGKRHFRCQAIT